MPHRIPRSGGREGMGLLFPEILDLSLTRGYPLSAGEMALCKLPRGNGDKCQYGARRIPLPGHTLPHI